MRPVDADEIIEKLNSIKTAKGDDTVMTIDAVIYLITKFPMLTMQEIEEEYRKVKINIIQ